MSRILELLKKPLYLVLVLLILSLGALGVLYNQYQKTQSELANAKKDPQIARTEETKKLVEQVSRVMVLPSSETPTVATITDISKIKNQPFFAKAENGDKLLIYTNARRAILFRPSTNKVIDVAPVNIGSTTQPATPSGTITPSVRPTSVITPTPTLTPTITSEQ